MTRLRCAFLLALLGCGAGFSAQAFDMQAAPAPALGTQQAAFAPWDDVEGLIVAAIDGAKKQVLMQAYLLTSKPIAAALIAAQQRQVDVRVLVDAEQLRRTPASKVDALVTAGIPVWLETKYQNAHNKVIVIDASTPDASVLTGSYNFTWTAQRKNAENILILHGNQPLAARYAMNWERHRQDATPYKK